MMRSPTITLIGPSGDAGDYDISTYSFKDKKNTRISSSSLRRSRAAVSRPDGKWMAYESNEMDGRKFLWNRIQELATVSDHERRRQPSGMGSRHVRGSTSTTTAAMGSCYAVNIRTQPTFTSKLRPKNFPLAVRSAPGHLSPSVRHHDRRQAVPVMISIGVDGAADRNSSRTGSIS
jgi:hypothetical protein